MSERSRRAGHGVPVGPAREPGHHLPIRRTWPQDTVALVVLSVAARLPWVLLAHSGPFSDYFFYYLGAKSIAAGHGYAVLGHPTAFFPVGWPAFLGGLFLITGPSYAAVKAVNLVLWALTTVLVYALGRRLGGRSVGLVAGGLVAVAPTMTIYAMDGASEGLFIPLLLSACLLVLTKKDESPSTRRAVFTGALLGLAILVRSTAILLPFVLSLWLLLRRPARESWRAATATALVSMLVLVPWAARNAVVMHSYGLSTNGGYTIWMGANSHATGGFDAGSNHWPIRSAATEARQNSRLMRESISWVSGHPLDWLELIPAKFTHLMVWRPRPIQNDFIYQTGNDPRVGWHVHRLSGAEATLINGSLHHLWLFDLWHYSYWALGGIALVLAARKRLEGAGLAALIVAFWIVFHVTIVHGEPRYMLSVAPLVAPALAWLLVETYRRARTFA